MKIIACAKASIVQTLQNSKERLLMMISSHKKEDKSINQRELLHISQIPPSSMMKRSTIKNSSKIRLQFKDQQLAKAYTSQTRLNSKENQPTSILSKLIKMKMPFKRKVINTLVTKLHSMAKQHTTNTIRANRTKYNNAIVHVHANSIMLKTSNYTRKRSILQE